MNAHLNSLVLQPNNPVAHDLFKHHHISFTRSHLYHYGDDYGYPVVALVT